MKDQDQPASARRRATSGNGPGREPAGGTNEDLEHIGRAGKGLGGSDDTGGARYIPDLGTGETTGESALPPPPDDVDLPMNPGP